MSEQIEPQLIIDELVKRVQALTLENIVLSSRLAKFQGLPFNADNQEIPSPASFVPQGDQQAD
jgi:hypothetical protein